MGLDWISGQAFDWLVVGQVIATICGPGPGPKHTVRKGKTPGAG